MDPELVDRIYESSFVPELWPGVLDELGRIGEGGGTLIISKAEVQYWTAAPKAREGVERYVNEGWFKRGQSVALFFAARHAGFLTELDLFTPDELRGITDRINVFADLFGLTSAEARVVSQLVSGGGLTKAASHLNIARSTARSHLTNILEKTGTYRQAELVRGFYEVTLPWCGRCRAEDKSRAAVAAGLAARDYGQGIEP